MNAALLFSEADYSSGRIVIPISEDEWDECVCPYETYKTLLGYMNETRMKQALLERKALII